MALVEQFDKEKNKTTDELSQVFRIPGKWDMFSRNYEHDHIWLYPLYTSAKAFEGFPSPLVLQTILHRRKNHQKSNQVPYVQGRLTKAVSVYLQMQSSVQ